MQDIRVASVQFQHRTADKPYNLSRINHFTQAAAEDGAGLVLFPECCISGYWGLRNLSRDDLLKLAEPAPGGPSSLHLQQLAAQHAISVSAGLVEVDDQGRMFNTQVVAMPDGNIVKHRKLHCFISPHLQSGDQFTVFDLPTGQRAAVLICYDNNLVENVRAAALLGAELLLAPHQTGGCNSGSPFSMGVIDRSVWDNRAADPAAIEAELRGDKGRGWLMRWLPARAHDNGLFLVFSNGVGPDDDEVRTGNAMIIDCYGRICAETWHAGDDMVVATLDGSLRQRCTGARWIRSRRPSLYGKLTEPLANEESTRSVRFEHLDGET